jgi:hypothetical protein
LIDPSNMAGQLLLSHLVAIQTLIAPIKPTKRASRKNSHFVNGMARWLEVVYAKVDPRMRDYLEWPIKRAEEIRQWLEYEKALTA